MPGDSNMIQVGSLVGIMVMPGEDWQNVKVPGSEAAPAQAADKPKDPVSNDTLNESHLQMYF